MRIKDAEAAANARVAEAEAQAQSSVQDARRQAEKNLADGKAAADRKYQEILDAARAEADEEAKKTLSKGKRNATNMRKQFETGVVGVTDRVLSLFEETI